MEENKSDERGVVHATGKEHLPAPSIAEIEEAIEKHGAENVHLETDGTVVLPLGRDLQSVLGGYDVVEPTVEAVLLCAKIIHATIEAMNVSHNELTLTWEQSKDSVVDGINRFISHPDETPEQNHEAWVEYRREGGWVYGLSKDPVAKTHPCMVPYAALGPFAQSKDAVFHAIVRTFFGLEPRS